MRHIKILRLAGLHYPAAVRSANSLLADLPDAGYKEAIEAVIQQKYVYSNAFSHSMAEVGHEVEEVIFDLESLQERWARENGIDRTEEDWLLQVTIGLIGESRPDVLYLQDVYALPFEVRRTLKTRFPFLKKVVLFKGFPGAFDELEGIDLILACTPGLVSKFSEAGHPDARLVYHGFDPGIEQPDSPFAADARPSFSFVGSTGCGLVGSHHRRRYSTLLQIMEGTPLEIWANETRMDFPWQLERRPTRSMSRHWLKKWLSRLPASQLERLLKSKLCPASIGPKIQDLLLEKKTEVLFPKIGERGLETMLRENTLPNSLKHIAECYLAEWRAYPVHGVQEPINGDPSVIHTDARQPWIPISTLHPARCHEPVFGHAMYAVLRHSGVSLNLHTDAVTGEVGNMRLFEATGVGGCLLTDTAPNLRDLFEPDSEVATFTSTEECIEKAGYLVSNVRARDAMAQAGRKRTLSSHTTLHRCEQINTYLQEILN
jgi:hypothetical protein